MGRDLEKLFRLEKEKCRIKEIHISVDKTREPEEIVTVTLEKNGDIQIISSSEEDFCSYVIHLHSIPHVEDDESDFVYIDNPNKFFDIQKKIVDIFSGELRGLSYVKETLMIRIGASIKELETMKANGFFRKKTFEFFQLKFPEFSMM